MLWFTGTDYSIWQSSQVEATGKGHLHSEFSVWMETQKPDENTGQEEITCPALAV